MTTKTFHIGDILSITDGHLVSPDHIGGVYNILNWMTGDSLMTHQLPRVSRECAPALRAQHPDLAAIVVPDDMNEPEVLAWLATVAAVHGETREVTPLPAAEHTRINPITEFRLLRPDAQVIGVAIDPEDTP